MRNVPISQRGSVLLPVVVAITLLAAITYMLSYQAVSQTNVVAGEFERERLRYVAEAGIAHAKAQLALNTSCDNYADIPTTSFAGETYSVAINPDKGSPINIKSSVELQGGKKLNINSQDIAAFQPSSTVVLQLSDTSGEDAILDDFYPIRNYGGASYLQVNSGSWNQRPVLRFPLDKIPANATIQSARLDLRQWNANVPGEIAIHRLTRDWVEGTRNGGGIADGATWETHDGSSSWSQAGGDYDPTVYSTRYVTAGGVKGWDQWDVTSLVQEWVSGKIPNYGLLLLGDGTVSNVQWASRDTNNPPDAPKLTIAYACECGKTCVATPPAGKNVLLLVLDPATLTPQETAKRALLESWGHTVALIDDSASQAEFDAAVSTNDVAYVAEDIDSGVLGTKLRDATIGVVIEEEKITDEFGISTGETTFTESSIEITDNTHYITDPFSLGAVAFASSAQPVGGRAGTLAPGLVVLAERPSSTTSMLDVLETGATLADTGTAAGRRVKLPWGGNEFDINTLTDDGRTIMQRAIEWGAGTGTGTGCGSTLPLLLIVNDATNPTAAELSREAMLTSWCYSVKLMTASEPQDVYDKYVADSDIVYVPSSVYYADVGNKLKLQPIGIVNEVGTLTAYLGFTSGSSGYTGTETELSDGSHYITKGLPLGSLAVTTTATSLRYFVNTMGPGFRTLSVRPTQTDPMIMTLDTGDELLWGGNAPDRRVMLPWGGSSTFDISNLSPDGTTILRRSLEWAAGANNGPVAHWKLDDTSSTTAIDSVGGNDGQLVGSGTWTTGQIDGGLAVDYTDGEDYIIVPNSTGLENVQEGDFTLTAWFRPGSTPPGTSGDNDANYGILIKPGWHTGIFFTNQNRFAFWQHLDGDINVASTSGNSFSPASFYHVAATVDRNAGLQSLYVNGQLESTSGFTPGAAAREYGTGTWRIGIANPSASSWGWSADGTLDDVRIYDRALSAAEISDLVALGSGGSGGSGGGGGGGSCDGNFRDNFDAPAWNGNNGSLAWASDWIEVGESDGETSGDIQIMNDQSDYQLRTRDSDNGGEGVEREADLSGAATATLSYDYRRMNLDNTNDYTSVQISANGDAGPWQELIRHDGSGNDSNYQPASHDITAHMAANTRIRFITSSNMGGTDTVWFDNVEITCTP